MGEKKEINRIVKTCSTTGQKETYVFRNGNLGSLSMAAIVFTENPFVVVHPTTERKGSISY